MPDHMDAMPYLNMTLHFLTSVFGIANLGVAHALAGYILRCNSMMEAK
jgi:hypothetical protein